MKALKMCARMLWQGCLAGMMSFAIISSVLAAGDRELVVPPESSIVISKLNELPIPQSEQWEQKCANNPMLSNATKTTDTYREDAKGTGTFHWDEPSRYLLSIQTVDLEEGKLRVRFLSKAKLDEYTGPLVDTIRWTKHGASPGKALVGHTLTLGLGILFAPIRSAQHAFGCTDYVREKRQVDWTRRTSTGKHIWVDVTSTAKISISARGEEELREVPLEKATKPFGEVTLSLESIVKRLIGADLIGPTEIRVVCSNCVELDTAERSAFDVAGSQITLNVDLRPMQTAERDRLNQIQMREELAIREAQTREQEEIARRKRQTLEEAAKKKRLEEEERQRKLQQQKKEQIFSM